jgi:hypothetical protein
MRGDEWLNPEVMVLVLRKVVGIASGGCAACASHVCTQEETMDLT